MKAALTQIVNAVLYEGYLLYPYRASSPKNQRERFTFGRVYPRAYSEVENGGERCVMQAECLLRATGPAPRVSITLGFLQPARREIGVLNEPSPAGPEAGGAEFQSVRQIEVNGKLYQSGAEAIERQVFAGMKVAGPPVTIPFAFPAGQSRDPILNEKGEAAGLIIHRRQSLNGEVYVATARLAPELYKVSVRVTNVSPLESADLVVSDEVLQRTFASTHFVLEAADAEFVSLLETPAEWKQFAERCENLGCWPVLVGDEAARERDAMLASPIILYDYPKISPESAGDFFDGTEIDEMLTLRVLTLTDREKQEMRADPFARRILERTNALGPEDFLKLHGSLRETPSSEEEFFNPTRPRQSVVVDSVELRAGDRVVIRPKHRADAIDLVLAGRTGVIEAVEEDAEGGIHLALVLPDDPGQDLGFARQSGHRFFFGADEVAPLKGRAAA